MSDLARTVSAALDLGARVRPAVFGFPYLAEALRSAGVEVLKGPESDFNGKFAWILDPDGNKVELWEPKAPDEKNYGS